MGLLKDSHDGKEVDPSADPEEKEKEYEELFLKMGRDFVTKEDFVDIMNTFVNRLTQGSTSWGNRLRNINFSQDTQARAKALVYKDFVENEKDGVETFAIFDLAKIEEKEEDDE